MDFKEGLRSEVHNFLHSTERLLRIDTTDCPLSDLEWGLLGYALENVAKKLFHSQIGPSPPLA